MSGAAAVLPAPRALAAAWPRRLREAALSYLPVLLMALLALATWWLVKSTPIPGEQAPEAPLRHEPDYTMTTFLVQRFAPDGALQVQIEGDRLQHYPDTDTLEIERPRIRAFGADGRITDAAARRALSNGDASEVQLFGDASVVRSATPTDEAVEFRSEFLHGFANAERVRSHLPVVLRSGATELRADAFEYDNLARTVDFKGHVHAVFAPPKRSVP
jgi:lipopolysaccharide export system protein LptC